eukprot:193720_1
MAFQPSGVDEKKSDVDSDDELNCFQESIVHSDGDKRKAIIESPHKTEPIIKCIGQLESEYKYVNKGYDPANSWGTGTVFSVKGDVCSVLSAAHTARKKVKECSKCMKYMDCITNKQVVVKCIHCGCGKLEYKIIPATKILFSRREIRQKSQVYDEEEKE